MTIGVWLKITGVMDGMAMETLVCDWSVLEELGVVVASSVLLCVLS